MSEAPKPVGAYTPIVRAGDWLVVSGQVGITGDGQMAGGGTGGELRQAIANLEAQLATQGARLDQVVKTTVFLRHMNDYSVMNDTYVECFGDHRPARSAVGVAELPIGALIEIEAWAWVGPAGPEAGS
jgi:2-iminobutanoate/2-iminopropanoate deaminase